MFWPLEKTNEHVDQVTNGNIGKVNSMHTGQATGVNVDQTTSMMVKLFVIVLALPLMNMLPKQLNKILA